MCSEGRKGKQNLLHWNESARGHGAQLSKGTGTYGTQPQEKNISRMLSQSAKGGETCWTKVGMCSAAQPTSSEISGFLSLVASHSRDPAPVFVSLTNSSSSSSSSRSGQLCEAVAPPCQQETSQTQGGLTPPVSCRDSQGWWKAKAEEWSEKLLKRNKYIYRKKASCPWPWRQCSAHGYPPSHSQVFGWREQNTENLFARSEINAPDIIRLIGAVLNDSKAAHGNRWQ